MVTRISCELPRHSAAEVVAMKEDLQHHGLLTPIVVDEQGNIIDGRERAPLCDELKIDWKATAKVVKVSPEQAAAMRLRLNLLHRKKLPTREQRQAYVEVMIKGEPELSDSYIASLCGYSAMQVGRIRSSLGTAGAAAQRKGKDGKVRSVAKKPDAAKTFAPVTWIKQTTENLVKHRDLIARELQAGKGKEEFARLFKLVIEIAHLAGLSK